MTKQLSGQLQNQQKFEIHLTQYNNKNDDDDDDDNNNNRFNYYYYYFIL